MSAATFFPNAPMPTEVRRFAVDEYQQMIRSGILRDGEKVELLEGWIVPKMGQDSQHRKSVVRVRKRVEPHLPPNWYLQDHSPIATKDSEPEPDIAAIRGDMDVDEEENPSAEDVGLV